MCKCVSDDTAEEKSRGFSPLLRSMFDGGVLCLKEERWMKEKEVRG
jgi:hypothetical protein